MKRVSKRRLVALLVTTLAASGLFALPAHATTGLTLGANSTFYAEVDSGGNQAWANKYLNGNQNTQVWNGGNNPGSKNGFMWYMPDAPASTGTSRNYGTYYLGGTTGNDFTGLDPGAPGKGGSPVGTLGNGTIAAANLFGVAGAQMTWNLSSTKGLQFTHFMDMNVTTGVANQRWSVTNTGATTLRGNKLFWGGDTNFAGSPQGYTDVLVGMNTLFTGNTTNANAGTLAFTGSAMTPWSGYYGGTPAGGLAAVAAHALPNTVTGQAAGNVDASLFVEWSLPDLAPGQTASVDATTTVKMPDPMTVLASSPNTGRAGDMAAHTFVVVNSGNAPLAQIAATPSATLGWEVIMVQPPATDLAPGQSTEITVLVLIPPGAAVGSTSTVTLAVTALSGLTTLPRSASTTTKVVDANDWMADVFTGNAGISGLNMPGQVLTAQSSWSMEPDSLSYKWYLNGTELLGQSGKTLSALVTDPFVNGDFVRVEVTGTKAGFPNFVATAMIPIVSPRLIGSAQISGLLFVDETLHAEISWNYDGVNTSGIYWTVNGTRKSAFDGQLYFSTAGLQVGDVVWVHADGTKSGFQAAAAETGARLGARSFQGSVAITGLAMPGNTLTAVANWTAVPDSVVYTWTVNDQVVQTGPSNTFNTSGRNPGDVVKVLATASKTGSLDAAAETQRTLFDPPVAPGSLYGSATIVGLYEVGQELTGSAEWNETPDSVEYCWYIDAAAEPELCAETFDTTGLADQTVVRLVAKATKAGYVDAEAETSAELFAPTHVLDDLHGSVYISGKLIPGQVLTAGSSWDVEPDSLTYYWFVGSSPTESHIGPYFDTTGLLSTDSVRLEARATKTDYNPATVSTVAYLGDPPPPPLADIGGSLSITGDLRPGHVLLAEDFWALDPIIDDLVVSYQWYVDGVPVDQATTDSFDTTGLHGGQEVSVEVTGAVPGYNNTVLSAAVNLSFLDLDGSVEIIGTFLAGYTLVALDSWYETPDSVTYEWYVNGALRDDVTGASFDTTGLIGGDVIKVVARATLEDYNDGLATDEITLQLFDLSGYVYFDGLLLPGTTLTAITSWNTIDVDEVYTWYVNGVQAKQASAANGGATFDTTGLWGGDEIEVVVEGTKTGYSNGIIDVTTELLLIHLDGAAHLVVDSTSPIQVFEPGVILRCDVEWNETPDSQTVTWFRSGSVVTGATGWTLDTTGWSSGQIAECDVYATKFGLVPGSVSAQQVIAYLPTFTGSVSIGGGTTVGSTLTATPSWSETPNSVTYQWYVDGTAVPSATSATFSTSGYLPSQVVRVEVTARVLGFQDLTVSDSITLTTNDPGSIQITLKAWKDVPAGSDSSAADIEQYGTQVPLGSVLASGTKIWWTYHVVNPSMVTITSIIVTDSMLNNSIVPGDYICSIGSLAPSAGSKCFSSATL